MGVDLLILAVEKIRGGRRRPSNKAEMVGGTSLDAVLAIKLAAKEAKEREKKKRRQRRSANRYEFLKLSSSQKEAKSKAAPGSLVMPPNAKARDFREARLLDEIAAASQCGCGGVESNSNSFSLLSYLCETDA